MIFRIIASDRNGANHGGRSLAGGLADLSDIEIRRVFFFQTDGTISTDQIAALAKHLADPVLRDRKCRTADSMDNIAGITSPDGLVLAGMNTELFLNGVRW